MVYVFLSLYTSTHSPTPLPELSEIKFIVHKLLFPPLRVADVVIIEPTSKVVKRTSTVFHEYYDDTNLT